MSGAHPDARLRDPDLPAAELLLSSAAAEALAATVAPRGGVVRQAKPTFVDYTPGRSVHVAYDAFVEWPNSAAPETLVATARADGRVRGAELVEAAGTAIGVWRALDDPYMPGLAAANDLAFVEGLLERLGLSGGKIRLEPLGYTPRSRSVVRVLREPVGGRLQFVPGRGIQAPAAEPVLYLKAMRPERAERLRRSQRALEGVMPVARCVADLEQLALMAFEPLPGVPLFECVVDGVHPVPGAEELRGLLDRIRDVPIDAAARLTTTKSVRLNAVTLAAVMPSQAERLERFLESLGDDRPQPEVTIHGDFHEIQLLIGPDGLSGVLDLDDAGRGQRVDDFAMMLGRLFAFSETADRGRERIADYLWSLLAAWEQHVDPHELRRRMAGVAMNHALMPFRWQQPDWRRQTAAGIARAERLLRELTAPTLARR